MNYEKTFVDLLKNSSLFRHLINKAKNRVPVVVVMADGSVIKGRLRNVDWFLKLIEIEYENGVYFVNLARVLYIKVEKSEARVVTFDKEW